MSIFLPFDCPENHKNYEGCIIPDKNNQDATRCPHWNKCYSRTEKKWEYVPLK